MFEQKEFEGYWWTPKSKALLKSHEFYIIAAEATE